MAEEQQAGPLQSIGIDLSVESSESFVKELGDAGTSLRNLGGDLTVFTDNAKSFNSALLRMGTTIGLVNQSLGKTNKLANSIKALSEVAATSDKMRASAADAATSINLQARAIENLAASMKALQQVGGDIDLSGVMVGAKPKIDKGAFKGNAQVRKEVEAELERELKGLDPKASEDAIAGFLQTAIQNAITTVANRPSTKKEDSLLLGDLLKSSKSVTAGFVKGLREGTDEMESAAVFSAGSVIKAFEKAFGIASPSKEMARIGFDLVRGLISGTDAGANALRASAQNLARIYLSEFKSVLASERGEMNLGRFGVSGVGTGGSKGGGKSDDVNFDFNSAPELPFDRLEKALDDVVPVLEENLKHAERIRQNRKKVAELDAKQAAEQKKILDAAQEQGRTWTRKEAIPSQAHSLRNRLFAAQEMPAWARFELMRSLVGVSGFNPDTSADSTSWGGYGSQTKRTADKYGVVDPFKNVIPTSVRKGAGQSMGHTAFNISFSSPTYQDLMRQAYEQGGLTEDWIISQVNSDMSEAIDQYYSPATKPMKWGNLQAPVKSTYRKADLEGEFRDLAQRAAEAVFQQGLQIPLDNARGVLDSLMEEGGPGGQNAARTAINAWVRANAGDSFGGMEKGLGEDVSRFLADTMRRRAKQQQRMEAGVEPFVYSGVSEEFVRYRKILTSSDTLTDTISNLIAFDKDLKKFYRDKAREANEQLGKLQAEGRTADDPQVQEAENKIKFYGKLANRQDPYAQERIQVLRQTRADVEAAAARKMVALQEELKAINEGQGEAFIDKRGRATQARINAKIAANKMRMADAQATLDRFAGQEVSGQDLIDVLGAKDTIEQLTAANASLERAAGRALHDMEVDIMNIDNGSRAKQIQGEIKAIQDKANAQYAKLDEQMASISAAAIADPVLRNAANVARRLQRDAPHLEDAVLRDKLIMATRATGESDTKLNLSGQSRMWQETQYTGRLEDLYPSMEGAIPVDEMFPDFLNRFDKDVKNVGDAVETYWKDKVNRAREAVRMVGDQDYASRLMALYASNSSKDNAGQRRALRDVLASTEQGVEFQQAAQNASRVLGRYDEYLQALANDPNNEAIKTSLSIVEKELFGSEGFMKKLQWFMVMAEEQASILIAEARSGSMLSLTQRDIQRMSGDPQDERAQAVISPLRADRLRMAQQVPTVQTGWEPVSAILGEASIRDEMIKTPHDAMVAVNRLLDHLGQQLEVATVEYINQYGEADFESLRRLMQGGVAMEHIPDKGKFMAGLQQRINELGEYSEQLYSQALADDRKRAKRDTKVGPVKVTDPTGVARLAEEQGKAEKDLNAELRSRQIEQASTIEAIRDVEKAHAAGIVSDEEYRRSLQMFYQVLDGPGGLNAQVLELSKKLNATATEARKGANAALDAKKIGGEVVKPVTEAPRGSIEDRGVEIRDRIAELRKQQRAITAEAAAYIRTQAVAGPEADAAAMSGTLDALAKEFALINQAISVESQRLKNFYVTTRPRREALEMTAEAGINNIGGNALIKRPIGSDTSVFLDKQRIEEARQIYYARQGMAAGQVRSDLDGGYEQIRGIGDVGRLSADFVQNIDMVVQQFYDVIASGFARAGKDLGKSFMSLDPSLLTKPMIDQLRHVAEFEPEKLEQELSRTIVAADWKHPMESFFGKDGFIGKYIENVRMTINGALLAAVANGELGDKELHALQLRLGDSLALVQEHLLHIEEDAHNVRGFADVRNFVDDLIQIPVEINTVATEMISAFEAAATISREAVQSADEMGDSAKAMAKETEQTAQETKQATEQATTATQGAATAAAGAAPSAATGAVAGKGNASAAAIVAAIRELQVAMEASIKWSVDALTRFWAGIAQAQGAFAAATGGTRGGRAMVSDADLDQMRQTRLLEAQAGARTAVLGVNQAAFAARGRPEDAQFRSDIAAKAERIMNDYMVDMKLAVDQASDPIDLRNKAAAVRAVFEESLNAMRVGFRGDKLTQSARTAAFSFNDITASRTSSAESKRLAAIEKVRNLGLQPQETQDALDKIDSAFNVFNRRLDIASKDTTLTIEDFRLRSSSALRDFRNTISKDYADLRQAARTSGALGARGIEVERAGKAAAIRTEDVFGKAAALGVPDTALQPLRAKADQILADFQAEFARIRTLGLETGKQDSAHIDLRNKLTAELDGVLDAVNGYVKELHEAAKRKEREEKALVQFGELGRTSEKQIEAAQYRLSENLNKDMLGAGFFGQKYSGQFNRLVEAATAAQAAASAKIAQVSQEGVRAAAAGDMALVQSLKNQIRAVGDETTIAIKRMDDHLEQQGREVDARLKRTGEMKQYAANPAQYGRDAMVASARYGEGLGAGFANLRLMIEEVNAQLRMSASLIKFNLTRAINVATSPLRIMVGLARNLLDYLRQAGSFLGRVGGAVAGAGKAVGGFVGNLIPSFGRQKAAAPPIDMGGIDQSAAVAGKKAGTTVVDSMGKSVVQNQGKLKGFFGKVVGGIAPGIGMGMGMSLTWGIINAVQSMAWRIQAAFAGVFQGGFSKVMETETRKMAIQAQAALEIGKQNAEKGVSQDFGDTWVQAGRDAEEYYKKVVDLAKVSSFGKAPLLDAFQNFEVAGIGQENALAAVRAMTMFADAFSPGNKQLMQTFGEQMMQMLQVGVANSQDIKPLLKQGIPVYEFFGRYIEKFKGMDVNEVEAAVAEAMSKGEIGAVDAFEAIVQGLSELGQKSAGKAALTLTGMLSTFGDIKDERVEQIMAPVAEKLFKPFLEWANELLGSDATIAWFDQVGQAIANFAQSVVDAFSLVGGVIKGTWEAIPGPVRDLITLFAQVSAVAAGLALAMKIGATLAAVFGPQLAAVGAAASTMLGPIIAVVAAIAAVAGGIKAYQENLWGFADAVNAAVWQVIAVVSELWGSITGFFFGDQAAAAGEEQASRFLAGIADGLGVKASLLDFGTAMPDWMRSVVDYLQGVMDNIVNFVGQIYDVIAQGIGQLWDAVAGFLGFTPKEEGPGLPPADGRVVQAQRRRRAEKPEQTPMEFLLQGATAPTPKRRDTERPYLQIDAQNPESSIWTTLGVATAYGPTVDTAWTSAGPMPLFQAPNIPAGIVPPPDMGTWAEQNQIYPGAQEDVDAIEFMLDHMDEFQNLTTGLTDGIESGSGTYDEFMATLESGSKRAGEATKALSSDVDLAAQSLDNAVPNASDFTTQLDALRQESTDAQDDIFLFGQNFSKAFEGAEGFIGGFVDSWYGFLNEISTNFMGWAEGVYQGIVGFFQPIADTVGPILSGFVEGFIENINRIPEYLVNLIDAAWEFGQGFVDAFAAGMQGAIDLVANALGGIGDMITSLLETHSPPKLLPDLENWGTSAADVWLQGWTKVDFSTMNTLASKLEEALQLDEGTLEESQISAIRKGVAATIDAATKGIATNTFVLDAIPGWGGRAEQVARLTQAYAQLAVVQHKQALEQQYLDQVTRKYDAILKPLEARLKSFQDQQEALDLTDQIKEYERVIANAYATDKQKQSAQLKLDELKLQEQINNLEMERNAITDPINNRLAKLAEEEATAQNILDITEARWDAEVGMMRASQQKTGADGGADGGADKTKEQGEGSRQFGIPSLNVPNINGKDILGQISQKMKDVGKAISDGWKDATKVFSDTAEALGKVKDQAVPLIEAFEGGISSGLFTQDSGVVGFFQNLGAALSPIVTTTDALILSLDTLWERLSRTWNFGPVAAYMNFSDKPDPWEGQTGFFTEPNSEGQFAAEPGRDPYAVVGSRFGGTGGLIGPMPNPQPLPEDTSIGTRMQNVFNELGRVIGMALASIMATLQQWWADFQAWWNGLDWTLVQAKVTEYTTKVNQAIMDFFGGIVTGLTGQEPGEQSSLADINRGVNKNVGFSAEQAAAVANHLISLIVIGVGEVDWGTLATGAVASIGIIASKFLIWLTNFLSEIEWGDLAYSAGELIGELIAGAVVGAIAAAGVLYMDGPEIATQIGEIVAAVIGGIGDLFFGIGKGMADVLSGWVVTIYNGVVDKINAVTPPWVGKLDKMDPNKVQDNLDQMGQTRSSDLAGGFEKNTGIDIGGAVGAVLNPGGFVGQGLANWLMPPKEDVQAAASTAATDWLSAYNLQMQGSSASEDAKLAAASVYGVFNEAAPDGAKKTWESFATELSSQVKTDEGKRIALVGASMIAGIDAGAVNYAEGAKAFDSPQALLDFFKREFSIQSPSQVFADEIGKPIGEGILQGINTGLGISAGPGAGGTPLTGFFAGMLAETTVFKLNLSVAFLNMKTAITGVLDTTVLEWQAKLQEGYELLNADFDAFAVDWIEVRWPAMTEALIGLLDTFKQGAVDKIKEMAEGVLKEVDNLVQALKSEDMIAKWNAAGADIGRALVDGMIDSFGDEKTDEKLDKAGEALINAVVAALKRAGVIKSPSKLMAEEIGAPLAAGVAVGMAGEDTVLRTAGGKMIDYAISGATDALRQTTLQAARPVPSMQSNQQAVREARGGNTYVLNLTTTPQLATNTVYSFGVLETFYGN